MAERSSTDPPARTASSETQNMQTPPTENTAAWVENYVTWASRVLDKKARSDEE
jgi:hypothetical protein